MTSRLAVVRCEDYEPGAVRAAVEKAIDLLGGINAHVSRGDRVLVKPNAFGPWEPDKAATTHPTVVEAVVRLAQESGATVEIGESAAGSYYGKTRHTLERTGIADVARRTSARLIDFDESGRQRVYVDAIDREIPFSENALNADVIISLPKLKTHGLTGISGAIKNMYGAIPGPGKSQLHREFPSREMFARAVAAICKAVRPALTIVDAIVAMEGNGPAMGRPRRLGLVLAAEDPVLLDTFCAIRLMGIPRSDLALLRAGAELGLGTTDLRHAEILGDGPARILPRSRLRPPTTYRLYSSRWIPRSLRAAIIGQANRSARPRVTGNCVGCGECVIACPTNAMQVVGTEPKGKKAALDLSSCISCFCCHETCRHGGVDIVVPLTWRMGKM